MMSKMSFRAWTACATVAAVANAWRAPAVDAGDLSAHSERAIEALRSEGILAVRGVPGLAQLRQAALADAAACLGPSGGLRLNDGTLRATVAAIVTGDSLSELHFNEQVPQDSAACVALHGSASALRKAVDAVARDAVAAYATSCAGDAPAGVADAVFEEAKASFGAGEHLEHLHAYTAMCTDVDQDALELHTDEGMMVAFVPSMWTRRGEAQELPAGMRIKLANGDVVEPEIHDDELVLMVGDGLAEWMPAYCPAVRSVPHAVSLKEACEAGGRGAVRSWYGRMFLPPRSAVSNISGQSFGAVRTARIESKRDEAAGAPSVGCSHGQDLILPGGYGRGLQACTTDREIYCWHSCSSVDAPSVPDCPGDDGERDVDRYWCYDPSKDAEWSGNHCGTCNLQCKPPPPSASPSASPSLAPTATPTDAPSKSPSVTPTAGPTASPMVGFTNPPTESPTSRPTGSPTASDMPSTSPTGSPTGSPLATPTAAPTSSPEQSSQAPRGDRDSDDNGADASDVMLPAMLAGIPVAFLLIAGGVVAHSRRKEAAVPVADGSSEVTVSVKNPSFGK